MAKLTILYALILLFCLALTDTVMRVRAQETNPTFKTEVFGTNQIIFHGCINLPPLNGTQGHVCLVEDSRTHIRYVIDELVGGCATLYGQGRWVEH